MSKKSSARELVKILRSHDSSVYGCRIRDALFAIIDALPEEAENVDWAGYGKQGLGGPEPKDERTAQPPKEEWPWSRPQPDYIAKFTGVGWYNSGDGKTKCWFGCFVQKDGLTLAVPLEQCRNPDGTPWAIMKNAPEESSYEWLKRKEKEGIEDARKLRIMKAMEEAPTGTAFRLYYGQWCEILEDDKFRVVEPKPDPEEQRIDKEIAEVKAENKSKYEMPSKELTKLAEHIYGDTEINIASMDDIAAISRITRHDNRFATITYMGKPVAVVGPTELIDISGHVGPAPVVDPPAMSGVPATPKSAAEKLWEGETWTLPDSVQCWAEPYDADPRWRRIKVREVR